MNIVDVLLAYAQLALGLAGFSALLVALSGSPHQWTAVDSFRIRNMLAFSFSGIFLALTPVLLTFFSVDEDKLWRISLAVLSITTLSGAFLATIGIRHLSKTERRVLRRPLIVAVLTILITTSLIEATAAVGSSWNRQGIFFAGLLAMLAMSIYLVVRFLFARPAG